MIGGRRRPRGSSVKPQGAAFKKAADAVGYEEFDPLARVNLGRSVETALLSRPFIEFNALHPFWGSGIYAIYFTGSASHPIYGRIAGYPSPVYVGRAVPKGARKGLIEVEEGKRSRVLCDRLYHHWESIDQAQNLETEDFSCRWLVADMLFVPMAEQLMIQTYQPIWNLVIDGFGNNDPGEGRYNQDRSRWDTLHPGRYWAPRLVDPPYTSDELRIKLSAHLDAHPPEMAPTVPPILQAPAVVAVPESDEDEPDGTLQLFPNE